MIERLMKYIKFTTSFFNHLSFTLNISVCIQYIEGTRGIKNTYLPLYLLGGLFIKGSYNKCYYLYFKF